MTEKEYQSDLISRQALIDFYLDRGMITAAVYASRIRSAQPTLYGYNIEHLAFIARVMQKKNVTPEKAIEYFEELGTLVQMIIDEQKEIIKMEVEKQCLKNLT